MKKLLILITTLLFLQGCYSKETFTTEQLQNLTNSVNISNLEKAEFDIKNNKLIIFTNDEIINKKEFEHLLNTLKLTSFSGKQLLGASQINADEFENKNFTLEVITKNENTVSFNVKDSNSKNYNITKTIYSETYIKSKISSLSSELLTFNSLVGIIETELNTSRDLGNKETSFNESKNKILYQLTFFKSLTKENNNFSNFEKIITKISKLEGLINEVSSVVNTSINIKNGSAISASFLYISDIDKIARELTK